MEYWQPPSSGQNFEFGSHYDPLSMDVFALMDAPRTDFPSSQDDEDEEEAAIESTKDVAAIESQDEGAQIEGYTGDDLVFEDDDPS